MGRQSVASLPAFLNNQWEAARGKAMENKENRVDESLFPDLTALSPLCLKTLLSWKAEQLHDLALRISELSSALNKKFGDFPDYEESHRFYSNLSRTTKNKYLDFPLAACAEFKIVTIDELNAFVRNGHTDIKINHLQKCFEFAQGVLRIKIKEPPSLLLLASACSAVSLLYRIINEPLQEDMLKTLVLSRFLCKFFIGQFFEERQVFTHFSYGV
jgi:hypothetical protein